MALSYIHHIISLNLDSHLMNIVIFALNLMLLIKQCPMVVEYCLQLCCLILYDKYGLFFILLRYGTLLLHRSRTKSFKLTFPEFNDLTYL